MGQKLPNMVADRPITGKCTLRPAVPDFLLKLGVVLLEQLQQSFLLDTDSEIGVFEFGGGYTEFSTRQSSSFTVRNTNAERKSTNPSNTQHVFCFFPDRDT